MKLYIDTSDRNEIVLGLDDKNYTLKVESNSSQKLVPFIDQVLKKKKKTLSDLTEIKVNVGPGSFTGLKVGVAVANTLGWSLGIKVNGKNLRKGEMVDINYGDK